MAYYIYNETPSGVINGVNTVFTLQYDIDSIVDLEINGVEYRDFTFSGNTITLLLPAPNGATFYVDYFAIIGASNTLDQIVERVYTILGENPNQPNYIFPKDKLVIPMINEVQEDIVKGEVVNFFTQETIKGGDMRFLRKQMFIHTQAAQPTTLVCNVGDTAITVNTTYYQPSGYVSINGNVIYYGSKTLTQLTDVQYIEAEHKAGSMAYQVRQLPENATFPFQMVQVSQGSTRRTAPVDVPYQDFRYIASNVGNSFGLLGGYGGTGGCFTVVGDNFSNANQYVQFMGYNRGINSNMNNFILYYYEAAGQMVLDTDHTALPGNYGLKVIAPIVAGILAYITDEEAKGIRIGTMGYGNLKNMYNVYSKQAKQFKKTVKINPILGISGFNGYGIRRG